MPSTMSQVSKRLLTCIPFIIVGFALWGTHIEHGDSNAGGMYAIVAFWPGLLTCIACYVLYGIVAHFTSSSNLNITKHFVHLILWLFVFLLPPDEIYSFALTVTLVTVLIVNLAFLMYYGLFKADS
jgi:hypothetical protein